VQALTDWHRPLPDTEFLAPGGVADATKLAR